MSDNPIKEDETQLIEIDFNDFGNNSSNKNVNSSKDIPIIKEISVLYNNFFNTWIKGDIR